MNIHWLIYSKYSDLASPSSRGFAYTKEDCLTLLKGLSGGLEVKNPPADAGSILSQGRSLEKKMGNLSILAWEIPEAEEMGSQESDAAEHARKIVHKDAYTDFKRSGGGTNTDINIF